MSISPDTTRNGHGNPGANFRAAQFPRKWLVALFVLLVGLMLTVVATLAMKSSVDRIAEQEFEFQCKEIHSKIVYRLNDHARILQSGAALFNASDGVTRKKWHIYTKHQKVEKQLPGILGIGFSVLIPREELPRHIQKIRREGFPDYTVKPEGDRELYSSIIYLEPFSDRNLSAFGYDMYSEPTRRQAMEQSRDTDSAALSGKVVLVQETSANVQAGTLMYAPVYRKGMPLETVGQRRAAIYGWVYSPYRMNDLMQGIFGSRNLEKEKQFHLQVFDGLIPSSHNLLYECHPATDQPSWPDKRFSRHIPVDFNGHRWTLHFTQTGGGLLTVDYLRVWLTMVGGTLITLLLFTLIRTLLHTRIKAQEIADKLTIDLKDSEQFTNDILDSLSSNIAVLDDKGMIVAVNEPWRNFARENRETGTVPDDLGTYYLDAWRENVGGDDEHGEEVARKGIEAVLQRKREKFLLEYACHSPKEQNWFSMRVTRLTGARQGIVVSHTNITDRKHLEETLRELNVGLESRVRERTVELERINRELEAFCYAISHEFRAPIARLEGYGSMLLEVMGEDGDDAEIHCARRIIVASNRLRTVIDGLLALNRLSRSDTASTSVNISEMFTHIAAELREEITDRTLNFIITPGIIAQGDSRMLEICMRNLLGNAVKYTSKNEDGSIEFGKLCKDGEDIYYIKDNGVGFAMGNAKNLYVPFCRLHTESEFEGTGIGLATVHRIIEKHNGRIWVDAEPGKGATFYFTLALDSTDSGKSLHVDSDQ